MNKQALPSIAGLIVFVISGALPIRSEDAENIINKVQSRMYYPQDSGLKDLSAHIDITVDATGKATPIPIKIYWKAPDSTAFRVIRHSVEMPLPRIVRLGLATELGFGQLIPEKFTKNDKYKYYLEVKDNQRIISGKRNSDIVEKENPNGGTTIELFSELSGFPEEVIWWLDEKSMPLKIVNRIDGRDVEMSDLKYEEHNE
jgi:hypothetical protein